MTTPRLKRRSPFRFLVNAWLLVAILIIWELAARANPTIFFPPLSRIASQFGTDWLSVDASHAFLSEHFYDTVVPSMWRLIRGWGLATVVGIVGGVLVARNSIIRDLYNPMIRFWMATPKVVLLPIALQVFGISDSLNIFLIFFGTVWLIMVNTADGVTGVDEAWLRSATSMRLRRRDLYLRVIVPAAMPRILTGIRVSIGVALILVIISELYATTAGLGYEVLLNQQSFKYLQMWSAFLLIAVIGLVLNGGAALLEKRVLRWQRRAGLGEL
ncbi:ABC transporter permease [Cryptosporangium sp. NPDC048952]|uniref:ABC transporter permease n=1 Tax=Cryptosporangium sp. NPDC048952 TaxID=3363961 RepID=UPI003713332F